MKRRADLLALVAIIVVAAVTGALTSRLMGARTVSLYDVDMPPWQIAEISRRMDQCHFTYAVSGSRVMVPQQDRNAIIGALLSYGLPRRQSGSGHLAMPVGQGEDEKKAIANREVEDALSEKLRRMVNVADAAVTVVPIDDDQLPAYRTPAKATVFLTLKPSSQPTAEQIDAIVTLISYSVNGLQPENVRIVDTSGHVWSTSGHAPLTHQDR